MCWNFGSHNTSGICIEVKKKTSKNMISPQVIRSPISDLEDSREKEKTATMLGLEWTACNTSETCLCFPCVVVIHYSKNVVECNRCGDWIGRERRVAVGASLKMEWSWFM